MTLRVEKALSLTLLTTFTLAMLGFAYYTDLFYAQRPIRKISSTEAGETTKLLFPKLASENIKKLIISNRLGSFELLKLNDIWLLEEIDEYGVTRRLPLREDVIPRVTKFVEDIEVLREIPFSDINFKTYSFNSPLFEFTFIRNDDSVLNLKLGVNNSLDNSNYLFSEQTRSIWKTKPILNNFANINNEDLVDPRIIDLNEKDIVEIEIERETKYKTYALSRLTQKEGKWYNSKNQEIERERLVSALNYLSEIKSSLVINEYNFRGQVEENKNENLPLLTLKIRTKGNLSHVYKIHGLKKNIPNLNLKKRSNLVVESSLHNTLFVINKQSMQIFENLKEARLRKLDLKKIFY